MLGLLALNRGASSHKPTDAAFPLAVYSVAISMSQVAGGEETVEQMRLQ